MEKEKGPAAGAGKEQTQAPAAGAGEKRPELIVGDRVQYLAQQHGAPAPVAAIVTGIGKDQHGDYADLVAFRSDSNTLGWMFSVREGTTPGCYRRI